MSNPNKKPLSLPSDDDDSDAGTMCGVATPPESEYLPPYKIAVGESAAGHDSKVENQAESSTAGNATSCNYDMGLGTLHYWVRDPKYTFSMTDHQRSAESVSVTLSLDFFDPFEKRRITDFGETWIYPCPNHIPVTCVNPQEFFCLPNGRKCTNLIAYLPDLCGPAQPQLSERPAWPAWTEDEATHYAATIQEAASGKGKAIITATESSATPLSGSGVTPGMSTFFVANPTEYEVTWVRREGVGPLKHRLFINKWTDVKIPKTPKHTAFNTNRACVSIDPEFHQSIINDEDLAFPLTVSWKDSGIWKDVPDPTVMVRKVGDTIALSNKKCRFSYLTVRPDPKSRSWATNDSGLKLNQTVELLYYPDVYN